MIWFDYDIESFGDGSFIVKGEWPGEVMGKKQDGSDKASALYKPGDVFVVQENGVLRKTDNLSALILKYKASKST
jgi:hypothetical protein